MSFQIIQAVLFFALARATIHGVSADCYSRNGILARDSQVYNGPELLPCGRGTNNCCIPGEKCGTNLLCASGGLLAREYCSNKDWVGCSAVSPETNDHGLNVRDCGGNIYCYSGATCCQDGGHLYYINPLNGEVKDATLRDSTAAPTYWSIDSSAILASSTMIPSPSTASSTVIAMTTTASSTVMSTTSTQSTISSSSSATPLASSTTATLSMPSTSSTTTTSSTTATPSTATSSTSSIHLSAGAGAGIGVGSAAAVAALAIFAWLFRRERKVRRAMQAQTSQSHQASTHQYPVAPKADMSVHPPAYLPHGEGVRHEMEEGRPRPELY